MKLRALFPGPNIGFGPPTRSMGGVDISCSYGSHGLYGLDDEDMPWAWVSVYATGETCWVKMDGSVAMEPSELVERVRVLERSLEYLRRVGVSLTPKAEPPF